MKRKRIKFKLWIIGKLIYVAFRFQIMVSRQVRVNKPDTKGQFILACWHAHQIGLYGLDDIISRINILISPSNDGQVITNACKDMGYTVIRGSKGREGATQAVFQMLEVLKKGDIVAIMIDGPKGPKHVVQPGIIELAKLSGIPIVPMVWYSPQKNFLKFKSWDEFRFPVGPITLVNLYGNPIYINKNINKEEFETHRKNLEQKLEDLYADVQENYSEYVKNAK